MAERLRRFAAEEGVVFIGKAQDRTSVFRTQKRPDLSLDRQVYGDG
jgi:hypothetical protein